MIPTSSEETIPQTTPTLSDPKLTVLNQRISDTLGACDEEVKEAGHAPEFGLKGAWDAIVEFDDAAGLIRQTIFQIKTVFDKVFADYFRAIVEDEKELNAIKHSENLDGEGLVMLGKILSTQAKHRDITLKQLNSVSRTLKDLHKESRETAQAKQATIPFTEVLKMAMAFKSVIHQEIHDKGQLDRISDQLNEIMRKLFPPGTGI